jgi:hypothetical protein
MVDGHARERGIGDVAVRVGERELHRLDLEVQRVGAQAPGSAKPSSRRSAISAASPCPFGGMLGDAIAAVVRDDRVVPRRLLGAQVVHAPLRAALVHERDHRLADRALVERVRALRGEQVERRGEERQAHDLARARRAAAGQERARGLGRLASLGSSVFQPSAIFSVTAIAAVRVRRARLERRRPAEAAEVLQQRLEPRSAPGTVTDSGLSSGIESPRPRSDRPLPRTRCDRWH